MNKRLRKKNSKINKNQVRYFVILHDKTEDVISDLDLYKDIYHNSEYPYVLFNESKWEVLYRMLRAKGFEPKLKGEDLPIFRAIYKNKLPIYLEEIKIMQSKDGRVIEPLIIRNDERNSILPKISELFSLSRQQGNEDYFPKHNKENTINYTLSSIKFLYKGYTFELKYQSQSHIETNAPNHIIESLIKKTSFFGYLRHKNEL
jgi:hypothetical protein